MPIVEANDLNMYYELHGPERGPVLVLNNGIIMNAATSWAFQTRSLSEHFRLLQYDARGQGQSDHPAGPYSMELHADDLASLLETLRIEQAHIAGISYGGEIAQAFALKYPHMAQTLILIDTVSEVGPELRMVIESWMDALQTGDPLKFFRVTVPWNFSPEFIRNNTALLEDAKARYADLDFPAVLRLCESFLELDFTQRLEEIKVPTCIMVGELDLLKGLPYAQKIENKIPYAELHLLAGAGHATCWERPEQFNRTILEFLARQTT